MMLRTNTLKSRIADGQPAHGVISSIPAPAAIELIAEAGFDFVIIDMEHVLINPETVENMIRVAESYDLTPLVRVADLNPKTLLRLLDGGAQGIVLPMIESPEQLADAIAACKYHPLGRRSLNAGRPGSFGKHSLAQYVEAANQQIMVVAMIESAEGVRRAAEIASVPGLDMILEGAADLSQSLGMPWQ
ncbi:siderophore biosynthesis protein SbnG, partial [Pseudomonas syringae]|nr:siderophore biosynthesis protein SbnG [Pseudomonas syringae]